MKYSRIKKLNLCIMDLHKCAVVYDMKPSAKLAPTH